jgi:hypothetical protein
MPQHTAAISEKFLLSFSGWGGLEAGKVAAGSFEHIV